jgi:ATP-binding cassette, subfamily B, bacterial
MAADSNGILYLCKELWAQSGGQRKVLVGAMALLVAAQCVLLAVPCVAGHAINALQTQGAAGLSDAGLWLLLVVAVTAGSWVLHGPGRILERNVALMVRSRISGGLVAKLFSLSAARTGQAASAHE